jgi:hypothetical protein
MRTGVSGAAVVILLVVGGLVGLAFADAPVWAWVLASLVAAVATTTAYVRAESRVAPRP